MFEILENDIGLSIVEFLQQGWWGKVLWYLLYPFDFVGSEMGFLIILPIIYWSVNKEAGKRLFILALSASVLTGFFKSWWHRPRPFHVSSDSVNHIATTLEPGLPSGHTVFATVTGLWTASFFKKRQVNLYVFLFILLMGLSRMVHGMHYPQDVVLGWILGVIFFWIYMRLEPVIARFFKKNTFQKGVLISVVLLVLVFIMAVLFFDEYETRKSILSPLGALVGGILGLFFEERFVSLSTSIKLKTRFFRGYAGIVLLVIIYLLLDLGYYAIFEGNYTVFALFFYTFRYMLIGYTVTFIVPLFFKMIKT